MSALYNEIEPYAAQWIRSLSTAGLIAQGGVSEKSIVDLTPDDVRGYTQAHFFAGIAIWSLALRMAGWPDDVPVWTGSCPCQPFSAAGKRKGKADERHLWPVWYRLIRECRPPVIFGEQVASPDGLEWFDTVHADLEREGYAVGASDLCAAGFGAFHIRQRLFFVAYANSERLQGFGLQLRKGRPFESDVAASRSGGARGVADALRAGRPEGRAEPGDRSTAGDGFMGDPASARPQVTDERSFDAQLATPWSDAEWIYCRDERYRPTKPGVFPLAHGHTNRVAKLRAIGNAISPQVAAGFIRAFIETACEG